MMTHAYSQLYLRKSSSTFGNMLDYAVNGCGLDGALFMWQFICSKICKPFEDGSPKYIAGKSGIELFLEVRGDNAVCEYRPKQYESYTRSPEYWVGWILARYQWYSNRSFKDILEVIPYDELLGLYSTLHEADVQKSYDVFDAHFQKADCKLKRIRRKVGMTQEMLAEKSGVSLNTIRAYERRSKDINKAQLCIVKSLAQALYCDIENLID